MKLDCLFCITPFIEVEMPLIGPCILSSVLKNNGYNSKVIDINLELYKNQNSILDTNWSDSQYFFLTKEILKNQKYVDFLDKWVQIIIDYNPRYVAITMFTVLSFSTNSYIIDKIREKSNIKIIVGGVGTERYVEENQYNQKADHYVLGYGEDIILKIIKGECGESIITCLSTDLSKSPIPDYSDLDMKSYTHSNTLGSYASKGCRFNCSFCGIGELWKYTDRPIENIEKEIKFFIEKYSIKNIQFKDSAINNNITHLENLCRMLIPLKIKWYGNWRIRKSMPDHIYDLLKKSGCTNLFIGLESGSLKVRKSMNKGFAEELIFNNLDSIERVGISFTPAFMVGYIGETEDDFQQTKDFIVKLKKYKMINIIRTSVFKNTVKKLKKYYDGKLNYIGAERLIDITEFLKDYHNPVGLDISNFKHIKKYLELKEENNDKINN